MYSLAFSIISKHCLRRRQFLRRLGGFAALGKRAFELGQRVGEPGPRRVIGGLGRDRFFRPRRRHHGDAVGDIVEDADD
jgi:hypothetical protein